MCKPGFQDRTCNSTCDPGTFGIACLSKNPVSIQPKAAFGPLAKRHFNGVLLVGQKWFAFMLTEI